MGWVGESFTFNANAANSTLTFETLILGADGPAIDNVMVVDLGVPQPGSLRVAVECNTGSENCENSAESAFTIRSVIIAGAIGTGSVVDGSDIDTAAELANYDVVVIGGSGHSDGDYTEFQSALRPWVEGGGGVVATGWTLENMLNLGLIDSSDLPTVLPVFLSSALEFAGRLISVTQTPHPVTSGISEFTAPEFTDYGPAKNGAVVLATDSGGNPAVVVWQFGDGRAVYLSPGYFSSYTSYTTASLLDGSIPDALNLFLQAVEWAGGVLD